MIEHQLIYQSYSSDARGHLARKRHKKMLEEREKEARAKEHRAASLQAG